MFDWNSAFGWTSTVDGWVSLLTLTVLEIVLGIDNIVFISILAGKLPAAVSASARGSVGLALAMITRILLLLSHHLDHGAHDAAVRRSWGTSSPAAT